MWNRTHSVLDHRLDSPSSPFAPLPSPTQTPKRADGSSLGCLMALLTAAPELHAVISNICNTKPLPLLLPPFSPLPLVSLIPSLIHPSSPLSLALPSSLRPLSLPPPLPYLLPPPTLAPSPFLLLPTNSLAAITKLTKPYFRTRTDDGLIAEWTRPADTTGKLNKQIKTNNNRYGFKYKQKKNKQGISSVLCYAVNLTSWTRYIFGEDYYHHQL